MMMKTTTKAVALVVMCAKDSRLPTPPFVSRLYIDLFKYNEEMFAHPILAVFFNVLFSAPCHKIPAVVAVLFYTPVY